MENEWVLTCELSFVALGTTLLKSHGHKKILMLRPIQQLWIGIDKKVLSFIWGILSLVACYSYLGW